MASSVDKYIDLLKNLLPRGRAWDIQEQPTFSSLIAALAPELCRVEDQNNLFLQETDPRITSALLEEWERMLGLPDECTPDGLTESERRDQVFQKFTSQGGLSGAFYEQVIADLGFTGTVRNELEFRVGRGKAGDALTNYFVDDFTAGEVIGQPLVNYGWQHYWTVELLESEATIETLEVGEPIGVPLKVVFNEIVECTIRKLKPAHSAVRFIFV